MEIATVAMNVYVGQASRVSNDPGNFRVSIVYC